MKKVRDSNLELYRIIVMMIIVAHHYVVNSGLLEVMNENLSSNRTIFYYLFGLWGKVGINCFVLITGYFMCTSKITLRKYLKLLLEFEFYNVVIYLIFIITGYESISRHGLFLAFFPFQNVAYNFASCFLMFYLCIPFLNILIRNMSKKMHLYLILFALFIYSFLVIIPRVVVFTNYISWFCILYCISSYIRLYDIPYKYNKGKWGKYFLLSFSIVVIGTILIIKADALLGKNILPLYFIKDSNYPFALIVSVCAFNYFRNVQLKYNKFINTIATSTFGVLLIHANSATMRQWLWQDVLHVPKHFYSNHFILLALVSVLSVFCVCSLLDLFRIRFIEKYYMACVDKIIEKRVNKKENNILE